MTPPISRNVLILGVGRSGTTALYVLLQNILENNFPGDVDYVYEPFLWNRQVFNKLYSEVTDEFKYASSVSVDGVYHHKKLPLFVTEDSQVDQCSKDWLGATLTPIDQKRHFLGKMIRGNGRIQLIRELCPQTKIIFVIRNPVDVINSSSQLFSFFGAEFYESDAARFSREVSDRYGEISPPPSQDLVRVEGEYAYWYYMNRHFLDYAASNPGSILTVAYEEFVKNRSNVVEKVCEFLGVATDPHYTSGSRKSVGPVKQNQAGLSPAEYAYLLSKLDEYKKLLELVQHRPRQPLNDLVKTTAGSPTARTCPQTERFNGLYAGAKLVKSARRFAELERRFAELERRFAELESRYRQKSDQLNRLQSTRRYRFANWLFSPWDRLQRLSRQSHSNRDD